MKKVLLISSMFLLIFTELVVAALTPGNIPKTKTGGTSPALQDSAVTELSGNIGIGSTTPGKTLDVQGTGRFSSTISASNLSGTNTGDQTSVTGNAGTATALAANGTNCNAGNFPLGVDASGVSESCTALPTTITGTASQITASAATGAITLSLPSTINVNTSGLAATATALAANGSNCSAGSYPLGVDASGASESCTVAATGTVTSIATTSPITGGTITGTGTIAINNAAADGSTKGAASFTAADFDASSGNISIDYTNGQAASSGNKGFLTSTDWSTFNNKVGSETNTLTTATTGIADDQLPVGASANVAAYKTVPDCDDTSGNHLNYDTTTNAFTCGTTGDGAGSGSPGGGISAVQYHNGTTFAGDATKFSFNGTNVGIGTSSGKMLLDVRGAIGLGTFGVNDSAYINVTGNGTTNAITAYGDQAHDANRLFTVNENGNVGIGTTSGTVALHVKSGSLTLSSGNILASGSITTNTSNFISNRADGYIAVGYGAGSGLFLGGDGNNDVQLRTTNFNTYDIQFLTNNTQRMVLDVANLGIGSAHPGTILDVQGTTRTTGLQLNLAPLAGGNVLVSNSVGVGTWMPPSTIGAGGGGSGTINSGTTNRHARYTAATTLDSSTLVFDDGTNVGIGTIAPRTAVELGVQVANILGANLGIGSTAPGTKLDVQGTVRTTGLQLNLNPAASYVLQSNSVGVGTWVPSTTLAVTATASPGGSSPQLQYNNAGAMGGITNFNSDGTNVGIGTTSYANMLGILGNVGIGTIKNDAYLTQATTNGNLVIQGNIGIGTWKATNSIIVMSNAAGAGNGGGNIGIGTLSPGVSLDVNGTTRFSGNGDSYFSGNVGIGTGIPMNTLSVQGGISQGTVAYTGQITDTNVVAISGNVGIGTWVPTHPLIVYGNVGISTTLPNSLINNTLGNGELYVQGNVGIGTWVTTSNALNIVGGNIGISTTNPASYKTGVNGIGSTSCLCKQYAGGICVDLGTCT